MPALARAHTHTHCGETTAQDHTNTKTEGQQKLAAPHGRNRVSVIHEHEAHSETLFISRPHAQMHSLRYDSVLFWITCYGSVSYIRVTGGNKLLHRLLPLLQPTHMRVVAQGRLASP